ncbi:MAG: thymidine phosphorylase, partial [Candidatus Marinimicrobia bacterium]|nr:thymidine phosphorylase [Candidatus Neomarinimicrobiota bacterium]
MIPAEIIQRKRDGKALTVDELKFFINGYTEGSLPDYQMSALLMAIYFKGMEFQEISVLTELMIDSGKRMDFSQLDAYVADKHSTGGVGDKVSIILGPLMAAAGLVIPMISGRGLGHTGGTLDKLETIPGFRTELTLTEFREAVEKTGIAMIGQTGEICPADKKIYALRDVTGTIQSIPLICGSIMSKKIAEGIQGLVLDVKTGNGAFMKTPTQA